MRKKFLIAIVGPTAVGKTAVSIELALKYSSEVISVDSRQFFRELEIGTAKPSLEELNQVPHHFINSHSISEHYDAGAYEKDALKLIFERFRELDVLFLVGGSGLYVDAVCHGMDEFGEIEPKIREQLKEELAKDGLDVLNEKLLKLDPEYHAQVDLQNPQRVIRALEVSMATGSPYSSFRKRKRKERAFEIIKVGLEMNRGELYERIDRRMTLMIEQGLFNEAERFMDSQHFNALQTVGYKEIFGYLNGEYDREEAVRLLKRNSRRYAKRQLTWFRKDQETTWFEPGQVDLINDYIKNEMLKRSEAEQ